MSTARPSPASASAPGRARRTGAGQRGFDGIAADIAQALQTWVAPQPAASVRGGCINDAWRWDSGAGTLFVKVSGTASAAAFEAEAAGLQELAAAQAVRVPRVLAQGIAGDQAYLALEWITLRPLGGDAQQLLGAQLAQQHRRTAPRFGWQQDNYIGRTPQVNTWTADWAQFFVTHRLEPQLQLAQRAGHGARLQRRGSQLLEQVPALLAGHRPQPSLLHGDLWGGNAAAAEGGGTPVIFDPSVYYGDREADLAMTRLFGGFGPEFHAAYEAAWPLPAGAAQRVDLYNLYHVLNHLNLFGAGYLGQAMSQIDSLLAGAARQD